MRGLKCQRISGQIRISGQFLSRPVLFRPKEGMLLFWEARLSGSPTLVSHSHMGCPPQLQKNYFVLLPRGPV
jgi:hypothetical protein